MINRNRLVLTGFCFLFAAAMRLPAQGNTAEVFGGYSYTKANPEVPLAKQNMNGWMGGATGFLNKWVGASVEIAAGFGPSPAPSSIGGAPRWTSKSIATWPGRSSASTTPRSSRSARSGCWAALLGRLTCPAAPPADKVQALAARRLFGFNQTKFAMLVSFPVDVSVSKLLAFRFEPGLYMTDFNKTKQSNFRMSFGPVFRFGGK